MSLPKSPGQQAYETYQTMMGNGVAGWNNERSGYAWYRLKDHEQQAWEATARAAFFALCVPAIASPRISAFITEKNDA